MIRYTKDDPPRVDRNWRRFTNPDAPYPPSREELADALDAALAREWRLIAALQPAWNALDAIDADPDVMTVRKHAEASAFYAVQRARATLADEQEQPR